MEEQGEGIYGSNDYCLHSRTIVRFSGIESRGNSLLLPGKEAEQGQWKEQSVKI